MKLYTNKCRENRKKDRYRNKERKRFKKTESKIKIVNSLMCTLIREQKMILKRKENIYKHLAKVVAIVEIDEYLPQNLSQWIRDLRVM